jgi:hypothetical protein
VQIILFSLSFSFAFPDHKSLTSWFLSVETHVVGDFLLKISDVSDVKCFGVYGCFPIDGEFITDSRPYNTHPESPQKIGVRYPVFTHTKRTMPAFIDLNDPDQLKTMGINPKGWVYFICHGYVEAGDRPWVS